MYGSEDEMDERDSLNSGLELEDDLLDDPSYINEIPITKQEQIDNKIMSSYNKHRKIILPQPKIVNRKVIIPMRKKNGEIMMQDDCVVVKRISIVPVLEGFENQEIEFPIKDWFNDSRTSSFILRDEANWIRRTDNIAIRLFVKSLYNPKINYNGFLNQLYWDIASFTDTSKGIEGIAAERAKTTFSKSETLTKAQRIRAHKDFEKAKKGGLVGTVKGWFGKK